MGMKLIQHPAYSPDLAPSNFFLFPNLKKDIRGPFPVWWRSRDGSWGMGQWGKDPDFFSAGLTALEHSWSKCITLEGNYIEKEELDLNQK